MHNPQKARTPGRANRREVFDVDALGFADSWNSSLGRSFRILCKLGSAKNQPPKMATTKANGILGKWREASN